MEWFLQKADDQSVFGPTTFDRLQDWANTSRISPLDRLSDDNQKTWRRAPTVLDLHMDWLVELKNKELYGPTTLGTIQEFMANGEINDSYTLIHTLSRKRSKIAENPLLKSSPQPIHNPSEAPSQEGGPNAVQGRIINLEEQILKLRRELEKADDRYKHLHEQYVSATGEEPPTLHGV